MDKLVVEHFGGYSQKQEDELPLLRTCGGYVIFSESGYLNNIQLHKICPI